MWQPEKLKDMIGLKKEIEDLKKCLDNGLPCVLAGDPGIGKTTSAKLYAKENGFRVLEINASLQRNSEDLENVYHRIISVQLFPTLFLFDEIDGMGKSGWNLFAKVCELIKVQRKQTGHSNLYVVGTCNERWKIPEKIRKKVVIIDYKVYGQSVSALGRRLVKEHGGTFTSSKDVRSALIAYDAKSDIQKAGSDFDILRLVFTENSLEGFDQRKHYIWLMENAANYFSGADLYKVIKIIALANRTRNPMILKLIPKGYGKPSYPRYLRRIKKVKQQKDLKV